MKKLIAGIAFFVCGMAAQAQSSTRMEGTVPFAFYVGNEQLAAGEYTFTSPTHHVVLARDLAWKEAAMLVGFTGTKAEVQETATLVFRKYGEGRYFLGEIWPAGSTAGVILPKSKREKEAVSSLLITSAKPEKVIIFAHAR